MHVEFIARGTGSARAAGDYLLGERVAAGKLRDGVEVRRGDPDIVAAVADAFEFEHKSTSGVIAWAPEDRPTDAQIEAVLEQVRAERPGPCSSRTATPGRRTSTEPLTSSGNMKKDLVAT